MKHIKKIFGGINLTYKKLILYSVITGVFVGLINSIPFLMDTSFTDIARTLEWWILFGIIIIMNSKSNLDSAFKCFLFFLISQPIIYLVEVPFSTLGSGVFSYYKFWGIVTLFTFPMGYIGYYLKKDKPLCLLILFPMICLLTYSAIDYGKYIYSYMFPRHILTVLYCIICPYILSFGIFNNKKCKTIGYIISIISTIIILSVLLLTIFRGFLTYDTTIMYTDNDYQINDNWNIYLEDSKYGNITINETEEKNEYSVDASFKKIGKTKLILENEKGETKKLNLTIGVNTYSLEK